MYYKNMDPAVILLIAVLAACSAGVIPGPHLRPGMEAEPVPPRPTRNGKFTLVVLGAAAACFLLSLSPAVSRADIYQWKDSQGTIHFTDDASTIPAKYRKNSNRLIREAPSVISPEKTSPPPGMKKAPLPGSAKSTAEEETAREATREEELASLVEQQRAKIAAKEEHIRAVDARRSLAINPLRNRVVDKADLDLYAKYKEELPGDRKRLRELESTLESIK